MTRTIHPKRRDNNDGGVRIRKEKTNLELGQERVAYSCEQHHSDQEWHDRLGRHPERGWHAADG